MANPSATYGNIRQGGPEGIRLPMEIQNATYQVYKELDLGLTAVNVTLTKDQAGASLITINPSAPVTLVFPTCQPGDSLLIQNLSVVVGATVTAEVAGNAVNVAVCPITVTSIVYFTGLNGGMKLGPGV